MKSIGYVAKPGRRRRAQERKPTRWRQIHDTEFSLALATDLQLVKDGGVVRIFCGTAHPDAYNDQFVAAARDAARNRQAELRVITGPILACDESGRNAVLTLAEEGVVSQLLHRLTMGDHEHFRIVETTAGYRYTAEAYPPPLLKPHYRLVTSVSEVNAQGLAGAATLYFDCSAETLGRMTDTDRRYLPIRLPSDHLLALRETARRKHLRFDHLPPETICRLLDTSSS
jgi:hypothetical protein